MSRQTTRGASRHDPAAIPVPPPWPVTVDLHLHTTASDGTLPPQAVVDLAVANGIQTLAISDHDTTEGFAEAQRAASRHEGLALVSGIELGAESNGSEVHLLGHFFAPDDPALQERLTQLREGRIEAAQRMVARLAEMRLPVEWDRVQQLAAGAVGRPHIARAMLEKGYVESVADAFDRYLGAGKPARVSRPKLAPIDALDLIHQAGGVATLAHPRTVSNLEELLPDLANAGLVGMEVYAEKYDLEMQQYYLELSRRYHLIPSGGTDYHASGAPNEVLPGMAGPPPETARLLFERARSAHPSGPGFVPSRPL